jgi:phosphoglycolate phosphatase-like HAD superfamily hydrolase
MNINKNSSNIIWLFTSLICLLLLSCGVGLALEYGVNNATGQGVLSQADVLKSVQTDKTTQARDPLPSWNSGTAKTAILSFVANVTNSSHPGYVAPEDRFAVIDMDGTLLVEKPNEVQFQFIADRIKDLAKEHPEWMNQGAISALLSGKRSYEEEFSSEENDVMGLAINSNVTADEYISVAGKWMNATKHPRFGIPYDQCVYKPMKELLDHLMANGFKVYVVTGSYADLVRAFASDSYGIPPEHVIGSNFRNRFEENNMTTNIILLPEIWNDNMGIGKPQDIWLFTGHRPIFAYGNSDSDIPMLQYATGKNHTGIALFNHHDDSIREYAYDRNVIEGKLDKGLDIASQWGWHIVSMKNDWKTVF